MNVLHRVVLPALNALLITTVLIYCMFLLIDSETPDLLEAKKHRNLDWVSLPDEPDLIVVENRPVKPRISELPPEIERTAAPVNINVTEYVGIPQEKIVFKKTPLAVYKSNQLVLAFAYPAKYPVSKLNRGIEGFVSVGFSVNPVGEVYDAFVIEAEPVGAFEKSALKAIEKFKYKPRYEDDLPVSTSGQNYVFRYEITK